MLGRKKKQEQVQNLFASGARAIGTLVDVRDTGITINDLDIRVKLRFRVEPLDGSAPFDAEKTTTVSRVRIPPMGARYPIFYDAAEPQTFAYVASVDDDSGRQQIVSMFGDAFGADASGVGVAGAAAPAPAAQDPLERLQKLGELHQSGVLTDEEFAAQKAAIMGSM
jgi:hypothetical protein